MKHLIPADILSIEHFNSKRSAHEREVLDTKNLRRIGLGDHISLLFENRVTMRWQIHEMCRVEGLVSAEAIAHELETYNAMLPGPGELTATLLIEYNDEQMRSIWLRKLYGLQECLFMEIEGEPALQARFDDEQFDANRLSSVQFVRFKMNPDQLNAFFDLRREVRIVSQHPSYITTTVLSGPSRGAFAQDLSGS